MTQVEVVVWLPLVIRVPNDVQTQSRLVLQQFRDFSQGRLRFGFDHILIGIEIYVRIPLPRLNHE